MLTLILTLSLSLAQITDLRRECDNECVNHAEKFGDCANPSNNECSGAWFEECLDDCRYEQAEALEQELGEREAHHYECSTDTECYNECVDVNDQPCE